MNDKGTLAKLLSEPDYQGKRRAWAEAIVRRAAAVARSTPPPDTENEDVTWAGDCADAILADAGLKDE